MTEQKLRLRLKSFLGTDRGLPVEKIAAELTTNRVDILPYMAWLWKTQGQKFRGLLTKKVADYAKAAEKEKQSLPQRIVNAGTIFLHLSEGSLESDRTIEKLGTMCEPYALYFLFAGVGLPCDKYRAAAKEYAAMFPDAVRALPEPYKKLGEALTLATT